MMCLHDGHNNIKYTYINGGRIHIIVIIINAYILLWVDVINAYNACVDNKMLCVIALCFAAYTAGAHAHMMYIVQTDRKTATPPP